MLRSQAIPPKAKRALRLSSRLHCGSNPRHLWMTWESVITSVSDPGMSQAGMSHNVAATFSSQTAWPLPSCQPLECAAIIHTMAGRLSCRTVSSSIMIGSRLSRAVGSSCRRENAAQVAARLLRRRTAFCSRDFSSETLVQPGGGQCSWPMSSSPRALAHPPAVPSCNKRETCRPPMVTSALHPALASAPAVRVGLSTHLAL
mmetsp:Transcript_21545/g.59888  ORF Transcript_21545/g.59888 Transcript_21545/m.59888 type:complete len:202 (-) Transcript_21545:539-1144(-)